MLPSCGCTMISDWLSFFISAESNPSFFFFFFQLLPSQRTFPLFSDFSREVEDHRKSEADVVKAHRPRNHSCNTFFEVCRIQRGGLTQSLPLTTCAHDFFVHAVITLAR